MDHFIFVTIVDIFGPLFFSDLQKTVKKLEKCPPQSTKNICCQKPSVQKHKNE